jgi:ribosome-binding factor A
MDERRTARVSEAIREELLEITGFEMDDPRIRSAEISKVEVSPDGRHAYVRAVFKGDAKEQKQALAALENAAGFLRHQLASRLDLRHMPELHFEADKFPDADARIELLLKRAGKSRGNLE